MTFAQFKAKLKDWVNRDDLDAVLVDFTNIALHKLEHEYNFRGMLTRASITPVAVGDYDFAAPADYKELKAAWFVDNGNFRYVLTKDSETSAMLSFPDLSTDMGGPARIIYYLGASGFVFRLRPAPSVAGNVDLSYFAYSPDLALDGDTNYLLAGPWEVLLYAALMEYADYIGDDAGLQKWAMKRSASAKALADSETKELFAGSWQSLRSYYVVGD